MLAENNKKLQRDCKTPYPPIFPSTFAFTIKTQKKKNQIQSYSLRRSFVPCLPVSLCPFLWTRNIYPLLWGPILFLSFLFLLSLNQRQSVFLKKSKSKIKQNFILKTSIPAGLAMNRPAWQSAWTRSIQPFLSDHLGSWLATALPSLR